MTTTDQMKTRPEYQGYLDVFRTLSGLKPAERVDVLGWIAECYCRNCGYPAPPDGEFCCAFSDRAVPNGARATTQGDGT